MNSVTGTRITTDPFTTAGRDDLNADELDHMAGCRTRVIIDDFYQCQIHGPDCGYAAPFGVGYLCLSDLRREHSNQRRQQEIRQLDSIL